ncbi:MAG: hypothetical protein SAqTSB_38500 [Shewanella algae]
MNIQMKGLGNVVINGHSYSGRSIQICGDQVLIDGAPQQGGLVGNVTVTINGDVESLMTGSGDVNALSVNHISTGSGDVTCGDVTGSITTGSGDVECGSVSGSVTTISGAIHHR